MARHVQPVKAGTVAAKRRAVKISNIRKKAEAGETTGNERGLMRIGALNTRILTGQEDLTEWDDEELKRGQKRDKNGRFQGRQPKVVPKQLHDEWVRRQLKNANQKLNESLDDAVQMLCAIATSDEAEDKDKLRAINMVLDRVMGKTPDKVEFTGDAPWMIALNAGVVNVEGAAVEEPDDDDEELE